MSDAPIREPLTHHTYVRERAEPRRGDYYYLHLSDLLLALETFATEERIRVLDLGCGGSPYRFLFPNADYRRADLGGRGDVEFEIDSSGHCDAPSGAFDLVLSTQVLEHCRQPEVHLAECRRVLTATGFLLLSTHGSFEEHACPEDFFRWTGDGLANLMTGCGFAVDRTLRVTAGPRAGFQLLHSALAEAELHAGTALERAVLWMVRRPLLARRFWHPLLDTLFARYRVIDRQRLGGDGIYVALVVRATPVRETQAPS